MTSAPRGSEFQVLIFFLEEIFEGLPIRLFRPVAIPLRGRGQTQASGSP